MIPNGTTLSHYRVVKKLGQGGMGEVYQATDLTLGREVAIKILSESFLSDVNRTARFQREAKILASLNHPNIAAIYGLEEANGIRFLVLELVEGDSLSDRLARGPVPVKEALQLALQIAGALETSHEKGILHRDLKPANIKVTPEGVVKVLDFGLAKALEESGAIPDGLDSLSLPIEATEAGMILGTAAYMPPEQACGSGVDKRCDIWSFGVVLFEMMSGKKPFAGQSLSDTLAAVLSAGIDWQSLPNNTPATIRTLLRRCLTREPRQRLQAIGEARIAIEEYLANPAVRPAPATASIEPRPWFRNHLGWIVAVLCLAGTLAMALVHFREAPFPASEMRLQINTPPTRAPTHFALSPDGRYIVFVASSGDSQSLWLRPLDKIEAKPIPGTDGAQFPFWSPDSQSVGFCAEGKLKRVNVSGGPPLTLANAPVVFGGGSWNGEGTILFGPHNSPILRVPASGGDPTGVTRLDTPRKMIGHRSPVFLPDDRHFLFLGYSYSGSEAQAVYLGSLEGGEPKRVMASETAVQYLEPDWVVYIRQGVLMARRFDPVKGELTGDPVTVADSVGFEVSSGAFSVSNTGLLAYRAGHEERRQLTWVDRTGRILGVAGEPDANNLLSPELSPDGRRIAIDRTIGNNRDLWLMDLVSGGLMRLTSDVAMDANPLWSPDGKRIVFHSTRNGTHDIWIKPASGTGTEQLLLGTPHNEWPLDWSDDGRFLLFNQDNPATGTDLWALPMTGNNRTPIVVSNTAFEERQGRFSPDGHWVAYETDESGTGFEIVVQAFPVRSGKWQVSAGGGFQPRWRADVKELYFIAPDGRLMAVPVGQRGSEFEAGKPVPLFETHMGMGTATFRAQYTVWRDGRFLISQVVEESSAVPITLILNWNPAQRK